MIPGPDAFPGRRSRNNEAGRKIETRPSGAGARVFPPANRNCHRRRGRRVP